jgi:uncharacterized cupin superfamily protein
MSTLDRRRVLQSAAALSGAAALPWVIEGMAQERSLANGIAAGPFALRAGESRGTGPWPVHNAPAFAAKVSGADVAGRYAVLEVDTPQHLGPALHLHSEQNEWFFLLAGSIGLVCGSQRIVLKPGDSFMAPIQVPHAYVTLSAEPARIMNLFDPAGTIEAFFADYARLLNAEGPPDQQAVNALNRAHGIHTVGPPLQASSFS